MRGGGGTTVKPLLPFSEDWGRRGSLGFFNAFLLLFFLLNTLILSALYFLPFRVLYGNFFKKILSKKLNGTLHQYQSNLAT